MLNKILIIVLTSVLIISCSKKDSTNEQSNEQAVGSVEEAVQELPAVCIWDKGSVRQEPNKNGKWISSMALGEKITWLGITSVDSTDKNAEYYNIKLSDGAEGWVSAYVVEIDASPAVIINEAVLYKRPDYLTVTDKKLQEMEIVALKKSENNWIEVVGEKKRAQGWIQNENISKNDIDIAVGLLATKAISEKDEKVKKEKINEIINNTAFTNSVFIETLKGMVEETPVEMEAQKEIPQKPDFKSETKDIENDKAGMIKKNKTGEKE